MSWFHPALNSLIASPVQSGANTNDPSRHHYIPEFYLRWWTDVDGRLERYTRPTPGKIAVRRVYPSETGFERKLYSAPARAAPDPHRLETRFFQQLDSGAARVLRKMNATPPADLSDEEQSTWSIFIRAMFYRSPTAFFALKESGEREWRASVEEIRGERYDSLKGARDPKTVDEFLQGLSTERIQSSVIDALPYVFTSPMVGQVLNDLHQRVIVTPSHVPEFLISDDPLARTNGLMIENGHLAIPISPRRLLVATWKRETLDLITRQRPKDLVTSVNRWVVESARHFVAARDRSQDRFIRNRFGLDPKRPISLG